MQSADQARKAAEENAKLVDMEIHKAELAEIKILIMGAVKMGKLKIIYDPKKCSFYAANQRPVELTQATISTLKDSGYTIEEENIGCMTIKW